MQKVKSKIKNQLLFVKVKLPKNNLINEYEVSILDKNQIQFLMKPNCIKKNYIEYVGVKGITLNDFLKQPISKKDFLFLIGQMVEALNQINGFHLKFQNIIWNSDCIFINQTTKEIQLIYLPYEDINEDHSIIGFFDSLLYSVIPDKNQPTQYLTMFSFFIKSQDSFHLDAFEAFINSEDISVMQSLKKYRTYQMVNDSKPMEMQFDAEETGLLNDSGQLNNDYSEETGLLDANYFSTHSQNNEMCEETGLLNEEENNFSGNPFEEETGLLTENNDFFVPEQGTEVLIEEGDLGQRRFSICGTVSSDEINSNSLTNNNIDDGSMLTGLLNPEDGGFNQADNGEAMAFINQKQKISFPKLYRVRTDEWILINKPVFRLGKEKSYVDYFVNNNSAVSRSHADIITRDGACYIKDLNSKNRTFINNYPIPVLTEVALQNGIHLKLANEEFIFQTQD